MKLDHLSVNKKPPLRWIADSGEAHMNTVLFFAGHFWHGFGITVFCLVAGDGLRVNSEPTFPSPRLRVVCLLFNLYRLRDVFASNPWGRLFQYASGLRLLGKKWFEYF